VQRVPPKPMHSWTTPAVQSTAEPDHVQEPGWFPSQPRQRLDRDWFQSLPLGWARRWARTFLYPCDAWVEEQTSSIHNPLWWVGSPMVGVGWRLVAGRDVDPYVSGSRCP